MTINYTEVYNYLRENKTHTLPCMCAACLYPRYMKRSQHIKGRKFDKQAFFIWWLKFEIKKALLIEKGKARFKKRLGMTFFDATERDFNGAPYLNEIKRIIKQLPDCDSFFYPNVKTYLGYMYEYLYRWKNSETFHKLLNELETEIYWAWKKPQNRSDKMLNYEKFYFAQKASDYIQKKGKINQRKLLRHFSAKRATHLEGIQYILKINYAISIKKEGKSIYYIPLIKTKGIIWTAAD